MTDRGRAALAAAEERAFGGTSFDVPISREDAERAVTRITTGSWWRACGPPVAVVTPPQRTRSSSARFHPMLLEIRLSDEQLSLATVAHELAHALAGVGRGHDALFRAAYVDLVALLGGESSAVALSDALSAMEIDAGHRTWRSPYSTGSATFAVTSAGTVSMAGGSSPSTLTATPIRRSR